MSSSSSSTPPFGQLAGLGHCRRRRRRHKSSDRRTKRGRSSSAETAFGSITLRAATNELRRPFEAPEAGGRLMSERGRRVARLMGRESRFGAPRRIAAQRRELARKLKRPWRHDRLPPAKHLAALWRGGARRGKKPSNQQVARHQLTAGLLRGEPIKMSPSLCDGRPSARAAAARVPKSATFFANKLLAET